MYNLKIEQFEFQKQLSKSILPLMRGKKAFVRSFGCQQNEADGETIAGQLASCGFEITQDEKEADLIIVNTCAIRDHAEQKALSITGQYKKLKEQNRELVIGLCGCMAQEENVREKLFSSYPFVDFVFGTDMHYRIPEFVKNAFEGGKRRVYVTSAPHNEFGNICEGMPKKRSSSYKAWVPVMYGCNNFCTYCVVPHVRGHERSREFSEVITEVKGLVESGYKEITLLGQNVNSYSGGCSFAELLDSVCNINGDFIVRFMTSHPKDASPELIDVIASNEKAAKHFHLPVQSGSNRILSLMNRRYTREEYLKKAFMIKDRIKDVALTSDIICGFPDESEEDFSQTLSLVKEVGFDMLYTFIYSPRPNTKAAVMENQISHPEKVRRFDMLSNLQNEISLEINEGCVGKKIRVLCEGGLNARSSQNKIITLENAGVEGEFAECEITKAHPYKLDGKIII